MQRKAPKWYNPEVMGTRIGVIIPARNEAANISKVVRDIRLHLPEAEIIVVDDHSDDGTADAAAALAGVSVLTSPISLGIGAAVQLGLKFALARGCDLFVRMDGDGQHRAEAAESLLRHAGPGVLVQGSRPHDQFVTSSTWVRKLGSLYFHFLFRACTARKVTDPTSGLMCFGRDIAEKFCRFYPSDYPEIESLVLLIRSGHRVISSPVTMEARQAGESSIGLIKGLLYMLAVTVAFFSSFIRKNPYGDLHVA